MAKTNFQYEKRQRELEKKKKADEKARRKAELKANPGLAQEGELLEDDEEGGEPSAEPAKE
ncbi:hypothetical protein SAMN05428959_105420 [Duganella sp. CF517]|jgi:hypothetical protein|uniref:hypothetical protein n=1 Tax=Duganella sp. CF517 TaxID=1881038 RepID=UPI0008B9030F|nr:hypothetical protein [Duganella sp. CF517]SEO21833.1 hypothetical protein SAMN05428959_105420 [Duganella sp. CF517]